MTRKFLWCKLKESVVTVENDFIPAETRVQVLRWSDAEGEQGMIECRAECFMHIGNDDRDVYDEEWTGDIGEGLLFGVKPSNLVFETFNSYDPGK